MTNTTGWVDDVAGYLPVERELMDWEQDKLRRDAVHLFPRNGSQTFDLAVSTMRMLDQMYRRLTTIWAEHHPLLRHNVQLLQVQQLYRAFHRYSADTLTRLLQPRYTTWSLKRPTNIDTNDIFSATNVARIRETLRADRLIAATARTTADALIDELAHLRAEVQRLERLRERRDSGDYDDDDDDAAELEAIESTPNTVYRDPGNLYLARLIERKKVRIKVLRFESRNANLAFQPDPRDQAYTRQRDELQKSLRRALNESLLEVTRLREAVAHTPDLFTGYTRSQQVEMAVSHHMELGLPQRLLTLYTDLYDLLGETTVREIIESELGVGE